MYIIIFKPSNNSPKFASRALFFKHFVACLTTKGICKFFLVGNESLKHELTMLYIIHLPCEIYNIYGSVLIK